MDPTAQPPIVWNEFRLRGSLVAGVVTVGLGVAWSWPGGFALGAIAAALFANALWVKSQDSVNLARTVMVDVTLVGFGLVVADIDAAGIGAPYLYMMVAPLLLLPFLQALPIMLYSTAWGALALLLGSPVGVPDTVARHVANTIAFVMFAGLLLVLIGVHVRALALSQEFTEQRLRAEEALSVAGEELLSNASEDALFNALEAIRTATGADAAFIAENSGDRSAGPAAVVRQVSASPNSASGPTPMRWTLPYMQHQEAAAELAHGRAVRMDEALGLVIGGESGRTEALAIPVSIQREWAGFLGLAFVDGLPKPEPDQATLETIAAMIGAFLERQQAYERLEKAVRSKDQFLASVSHEIRTPLTSISGFAAVLSEDHASLTSEDVSELIQLIQLQSQDVTDIVEDLLVAARTEIDAVTINRDLVVLADEIERTMAGRIDVVDRDIFIATSPRHVALADPTRVRQILRNLLTNAIRYGGEEITITTHRDGPQMTLVFSDNGDGVPPDHRQRIFDPYHRGPDGQTKPESIGLGLAVSRQLARLMGGDLTLRSDLSLSTFQLSLPAAPRPTEEADAGSLDRATGVGSASSA